MDIRGYAVRDVHARDGVCAGVSSLSGVFYMWVPRGGDFLTHPGRYGSKGRDQSPRDFSLPFRVTADGAPARAPPSQWAHGPGIHQRCSGR